MRCTIHPSVRHTIAFFTFFGYVSNFIAVLNIWSSYNLCNDFVCGRIFVKWAGRRHAVNKRPQTRLDPMLDVLRPILHNAFVSCLARPILRHKLKSFPKSDKKLFMNSQMLTPRHWQPEGESLIRFCFLYDNLIYELDGKVSINFKILIRFFLDK